MMQPYIRAQQFDVDEMDDSHIRLNFVRPDAADIDTGIRIIGETIAQM
ncbi:hypothetical protein ACEWF1_01875 [Bifidobacterium longum subsp. longum]